MTILLLQMTNQNLSLIHCRWNRIKLRREKSLGTSKLKIVVLFSKQPCYAYIISKVDLNDSLRNVNRKARKFPQSQFCLKKCHILSCYIYMNSYNVSINFLCPKLQTHAWHLLGIEQNRSCTRTYVCLSILPEILLPAADVSVAADDNVVPPNLTCATNIQLDLDLVKTPGMEAY